MACGLSKSLSLSSSLKKQGIVTILGGDFDCDIPSNTSAASLRRTFSADMSSKNWISQNGYCPMKRISSSEELCAPVADSFSPSSEEGGGGEEEEARSGFDIWTQIQEEKNKNKNNNNNNNNSQIDAWSTILSQKTDLSKPLPPPYVHPLVKRSSSSLSEKSLEICTESLGSETGSDGFSLHPSPETGDSEEENEKSDQKESQKVVEKKEEQSEAGEQETWTANYNSSSTICKTSRGSLPPPIPSLSSEFGKSLEVRSSRNDGRLVIEAVSVPSQNNFCATRHDGRLVLTFAGNGINPKDETDGEERKSEVSLFEEEIEEETEEMEFEMEEEEQKAPNGLERGHGWAHKPNGLVSVHRLAHKSIGLPNRNPGWPTNGEVKNKSEESVSVAHSLPPRPRMAQLARGMQPSSTVDDTVGAACFNAYDYYWKLTEPNINMEAVGPNAKAQLQAQKLHYKNHGGGGDAWLLGCKQQRKSLLFFEPFCIATS